ncbi:hypothetical protein HGRIS_004527 [Hohenbuehelia grisea]|uniref:Calcineurin-like phosphoesterase domain-containing protein n=1 Tax=Hohenbuehelia grisea TaxID=104357 RepID=A0ABR3JCD9_9AGAR
MLSCRLFSLLVLFSTLALIFYLIRTDFRLPVDSFALRNLPWEWQMPLALPFIARLTNNHKNATETARRSFTRHIVAVGDLHGDMGNAQKVLRFAGVVDDFGNWNGDVDFFVQTGDIIDRGDDTISLFDWMDKLREQASATGGEVLSLLGNHEWMNAIGESV